MSIIEIRNTRVFFLEPTLSPQCPSPSISLGQTYYFLTATKGTMETCKTTCMSYGGLLVTINTPEKSNSVRSLVESHLLAGE